MKRIIVTILAVFYLGVSSGATMHFHHCMGELVKWGLNDTPDKSDKCSNCGMKGDAAKDCCNDHVKQVKVDNAQKASENLFQFKASFLVVKFEYPSFGDLYMSSLSEDFPQLNSPPYVPGSPTYLRNCTFLI